MKQDITTYGGGTSPDGVGLYQEIIAVQAGKLHLPAEFLVGNLRFHRDGEDLIIVNQDNETVRIKGYFASDLPPVLTDATGGSADPDLVSAFLESGDHLHLAQNADTSAAAIGSVSAINGTVFVLRSDGSRFELGPNAQVFQGDIVETSANGSVRIVFLDNSTFALGPAGRMALNEHVYDPGSQTGKTVTSILKGVFVFTSGKIAESNAANMTINTPVVSIGIRGTKAAGDIKDPGEISTFTIIEGAIIMTNNVGSVILNEEGESTTVRSADTAFAPTFRITDAQAINVYGSVLPSAGTLLQEFQDGVDAPDITPDSGTINQDTDQNRDETDDTNDDDQNNQNNENQDQGQNTIPSDQNLQQQGALDNPDLNVDDGLGTDVVTAATDLSGEDTGITETQLDALGIDAAAETTIDALANEPVTDPIADPLAPTTTTDPNAGTAGVVLSGSDGVDTLSGTNLNDTLSAGGGNDTVNGGGGNDTIDGGLGNDVLSGGTGDDVITGGDGNDTITGDAGNDQVYGGLGDDVLIAGSGEGNDFYDGGEGSDWLKYPSAINPLNINLKTGITVGGVEIGTDTFQNIEYVEAGQNDDTIVAGYGDNRIDGNLGVDTVVFEDVAGGYSITSFNNQVIVTDIDLSNGDEGANTLENVEIIQFSDGAIPTVSIDDVTVTEGGTAQFTVQLSAAASTNVSVNYTTSLTNATASAGDIVAAAGTLIFVAGETSKTIDVVTLDDILFENNETFFLDLNAVGSNVIVADAQGQATINDNDTDVTVAVSNGSPAFAVEGSAFTFSISLSQATVRDVTVNYVTQNGGATNGLDFTGVSGTVTIAAGTTAQTITVNSLPDNLDENNETFTLDISNAIFDPGGTDQSLTITDNSGIATIRDIPDITVSNAVVSEGGDLLFTVSLNYAAAAVVSVDYQTSLAGGTAASGDFVSQANTLTFAVGETSKTVTIATNQDSELEANETFQLLLSNVTGPANLVGTTGTATIIDDDNGPSVAISDASLSPLPEGGTFEFVVSLSEASTENIVVAYQTVSGTALAGSDYTFTSGQLLITAGNTTGTIFVDSVTDGVSEGEETFTVQISNATLGPGSINKSLNITDNSGAGSLSDFPGISINDAASIEGSAASFTVLLSDVASDTVVVSYQLSLSGGTADANDIVATSGSLSFAPGELSKTITVDTVQDTDVEGHETYSIQLFPNSGSAVISDNVGVGTIYDNDGALSVSILDPDPSSVLEGAFHSFNILLSRVSGSIVRVYFNTTADTATSGSDYAAVNSFVDIAAGSVLATVNVSTLFDNVGEGDEAYNVQISNAVLDPGGTNTTVTIVDDSATAVIVDVIAVSVDDIVIGEGDSGSFTVSLSQAAASDISLQYVTSLIGGTAESDDFNSANGTLTVLAGQTSATVDIVTLQDDIQEGNETFRLELFDLSSGARLFDERGIGTIIDDDGGVSVSISDAQPGTVSEGENAVFTVTLSAVLPDAVRVYYQTVNGTATNGSDFFGGTSSILISAGDTTGSIFISTINDGSAESDEDFTVQLTSAIADPGGTNQSLIISDNSGIATIADVPGITIDNQTVVEGDDITFTVSLSGPASATITVDYATTEQFYSAEASDFSSQSGTLTFLAGETSKTITLSTLDDSFYEGTEFFSLSLSNPTGPGSLVDASGLGTITDNETPITVSVADGTPSVANEGGTIDFVITLSEVLDEDVYVFYQTQSATATTNVDFTGRSGAAYIAAGDLSTSITITTLTDLNDEADESFNFILSSAYLDQIPGGTSPITIGDNIGVGTIADAAGLSIEDAVGTEGGLINFNVRLSEAVANTVTVDYTTELTNTHTAEAGDFTPTTGTITFNPGDTVAVIEVSSVADANFEADETFGIVLSNITGPGAAVDLSATGNIIDDEGAPTIAVADGLADPTTEGGVVSFTISLTGVLAGEDIRVFYETLSGTALSSIDYTGVSTFVDIAAGSTSATIDVQTSGDGLVEGDETFFLRLTDAYLLNGNNHSLTIADAVGIGTITDAPGINIDDAVSLEGDTATFTITLTSASAGTITVGYEVSQLGGSASASDLVEATGTLTFNPGDTVETLNVATIEDSFFEGNETYFVNLTSVTGNAGIADGQGVGTILNDEPPSNISISDGSPNVAVEGNAIQFIVSLSQIVAHDVAVDYTTVNGSATAGSDFTSESGTLTIYAGDQTGTITITTLTDGSSEGLENFTVSLSNARFDPTGSNQSVTISDPSGQGSINEANNATWTNGNGDGLWHTAGNWSGGIVPTAATTVTITSGAVTISGADGEAFALNQSGGTLNAQFVDLSLSGNSTLTGGSVSLTSGRDLNLNGELVVAGGTLNLVTNDIFGGTLRFADSSDVNIQGVVRLHDVDVRGDIVLDGYAEGVSFRSGSTILQSNDVGPGRITALSRGDINFHDSQTIGNLEINFNSGIYASYLTLGGLQNQTFTFENTSLVQGSYLFISNGYTGTTVNHDGQILANDVAGNRYIYITGSADWTNTGTIAASVGNDMYIYPDIFTNAVGGLISVTGGSIMQLGSGNYTEGNANYSTVVNEGTITVNASTLNIFGQFTNSGTLIASNGSTVKLEGLWDGAGAFNLTDSTVDFSGFTTSAAFSNVTLSGASTVVISGTLSNVATTLDLDSVGPISLQGANVIGGTLHFANSADLNIGPGITRFDGVAVLGDIVLNGHSEAVLLTGGSTILLEDGSGPGQIDLNSGFNNFVYIQGAQTLSNLDINFNNGTYYGYVSFGENGQSGQTFTLSNSATIQGGYGFVVFAGSEVTLINEGNILSNNLAGNRTLSISMASDTSLVNTGTIGAANGNLLYINSGSIENNGILSATGSSLLFIGNSISTVVNNGTINADNSTVTLDGSLMASDIGTYTIIGSGVFRLAADVDNTNNTLDLDPLDTLTLYGATIENGILHFSSANDIEFSNVQSTFDNVEVHGDIVMDTTSGNLLIRPGTEFFQADGVSMGSITLGANATRLRFIETQTIEGVAINFAYTSTSPVLYFGQGGVDETFTIASTTIIQGGSGTISNWSTATSIDNQGQILSNAAAGNRSLNIYGGTDTVWTNSGTVEVSNSNILNLYTYDFTNQVGGTLSATTGGSLTFGWYDTGLVSNEGDIVVDNATFRFDGTWQNSGSISGTDATIDFSGIFDSASLAGFTRLGSTNVTFSGVMNNTGNMLDLDSFGAVTFASATINGGTLHFATDADFDIASGTTRFVGTQIQGDVILDNTNGYLRLLDGASIVQADGSSPGQVSLTGINSRLRFADSQTVENLHVTINAASASPDIYFGDGTADQNFSIANTSIIQGGSGYIRHNGSNLTITNDGQILANHATGGRTLFVTGSTSVVWTNTGTMSASLGNILDIDALSFANSGTIIAESGGTVRLGAASTVLTNTGTITVNDATLIIDGALSDSFFAGVSKNLAGEIRLQGDVTIDTELNIDPLGVLSVAGANFFGGTLSFSNSNALDVIAGTTVLDGTTIRGDILLDNLNGRLQLQNGATVMQSDGALPGQVTLTGNNAQLRFADSQTISNLTINFDYPGLAPDVFFGNGTAGQSFTIDASTTIQGGGGYLRVSGSNVNVTNQGNILANFAGNRSLYIVDATGTTWVNEGVIAASEGSSLNLQARDFTNSATGDLSIVGGGTFTLGQTTSSIRNLGDIFVTDSSLIFKGTVAIGSLAGVVQSGTSTVTVNATLENLGNTVDLGLIGPLNFSSARVNDGFIQFANADDLGFVSGQTTLNNVRVRGDLLLDNASAGVNLIGGSTVAQFGATTPGNINITGSNAYLRFGDSQTISDLVVTLDYISTSPDVYFGSGSGSETFTIASTTTFQGGGGFLRHSGSDVTITNDGNILSNHAGGGRTLVLLGAANTVWTNNGLMEASSGNTLNLQTQNFTNGTDGVLSVFGNTATLSFTYGLNLQDGILSGYGNVHGIVTIDGGTVRVGADNGTGTMSHNNTISFTSGLVEMELSGTTAGLFDQISTTSSITIGEVVFEISMINSFTPMNGDSFTLLNANLGIGYPNSGAAYVVTDTDGWFDHSMTYNFNTMVLTANENFVAGSDLNYVGTTAVDVYTGGAGNDFFVSKGGADIFDGGDGFDTLRVDLANIDFDLDGTQLSDFEAIDLGTGAGADARTVSMDADFMTTAITGASNPTIAQHLRVEGDNSDVVNLKDGVNWSNSAADADLPGYTTFTHTSSTAALLVDNDIVVNLV